MIHVTGKCMRKFDVEKCYLEIQRTNWRIFQSEYVNITLWDVTPCGLVHVPDYMASHSRIP
jgi:Ser-tRNA(Ala) deacylase AlaX